MRRNYRACVEKAEAKFPAVPVSAFSGKQTGPLKVSLLASARRPSTNAGSSKMRSTWIKSAVPLMAAMALIGCGDSEDGGSDGEEAAVRKVMTDLQEASRKGDGKRICTEIFTPKLASSVRTASKSKSCAKEVRTKTFSSKARINVEKVTVRDAANAQATIKEANGQTSNVFLVKQGGKWRVRGVRPA